MKLYGKNSVLERLKTRPKSICKIFLQQGHPEAAYISQKTKKWGIPLHFVPDTKIQKLARNGNALERSEASHPR